MDQGKLRHFTNRMIKSCDPTHRVVSITDDGNIRMVKLVARKSMNPGELITVPFLECCKSGNVPLQCETHLQNMDECPLEQRRREIVAQRLQQEEDEMKSELEDD